MNEEEIIKLWKQGFSRKWLYEKQRKVLKASIEGHYKTTSELKIIVINDVEKAIRKWYYKEILKKRVKKNE